MESCIQILCTAEVKTQLKGGTRKSGPLWKVVDFRKGKNEMEGGKEKLKAVIIWIYVLILETIA